MIPGVKGAFVGSNLAAVKTAIAKDIAEAAHVRTSAVTINTASAGTQSHNNLMAGDGVTATAEISVNSVNQASSVKSSLKSNVDAQMPLVNLQIAVPYSGRTDAFSPLTVDSSASTVSTTGAGAALTAGWTSVIFTILAVAVAARDF